MLNAFNPRKNEVARNCKGVKKENFKNIGEDVFKQHIEPKLGTEKNTFSVRVILFLREDLKLILKQMIIKSNCLNVMSS